MGFNTVDTVVSVAGHDVLAMGYDATIRDASAPMTTTPNYARRPGETSAFTSGRIDEREYEVVFSPTQDATAQALWTGGKPNRDALFSALDPVGAGEFEVVALLANTTTPVTARMTTKKIRPVGNAVYVDLVAADPSWASLAETVNVKQWTSSTLDTRQSILVRGTAPVYPTLTISPITQRPAGGSATVGWRWKQQITYTNTSRNNLYRRARLITLNTATEVTAGRMLASGNDLRIWFQGDDLPRTLLSMNTASTKIWFLLPAIAPDQSVTVDVVYGNPGAGAPSVLEYPDVPAFNLTTSDNGTLVYDVAETAGNAGKGLWYTELESGSTNRVRRFSYDAPGSWRPYLLLDNADDKGQPNIATYTVASVVYAGGRLYATRYRADASTDLGIGKGQGDGIAFYDPLGVTSVTADFKITNPARPATGLAVGKFTIRTRNTGGEEWVARHGDTTVRATPTVVASATYATGNNPHVYIGVLPRDEIEIPRETIYNINILAQTNSTFSVAINSSLLTEGAITTRTEVYDMQQVVRLHTASGDKYPQQELVIGRESFPLNRKLEIDGTNRTVKVFDFDGVTLLRQSPWAVSFRTVEFDKTTGVEVSRPSRDWFRIPGTTLLPGFSFEDPEDIQAGRWGTTFTDTQLTVSWTRDASQFTDGGWSLRANVTANSGGTNRLTRRTYDPYFRANPGDWIRFSADMRSTNANLRPKVAVAWYNASKVETGGSSFADWTPVINTWYGRELFPSVQVPAGAFYYRIVLDVFAVTAGTTGMVYFDNIGLGGADLEMRDKSLLVSTQVSVRTLDRYLG